jgi:hypothetical protein
MKRSATLPHFNGPSGQAIRLKQAMIGNYAERVANLYQYTGDYHLKTGKRVEFEGKVIKTIPKTMGIPMLLAGGVLLYQHYSGSSK